jgi:hypothetical protein
MPRDEAAVEGDDDHQGEHPDEQQADAHVLTQLGALVDDMVAGRRVLSAPTCALDIADLHPANRRAT